MKDVPAIRQLRVWFKAVGIECKLRDMSSVLVERSDGVEVVCGLLEAPPGVEGELLVPGKTITGRNLKQSLEAFAALQEVLGYKPKLPVDRGAIPDHKLVNGESFDLPAMRHTELRRVPNPTTAQLKRYELVVNRAVARFYRNNRETCNDHVLGVEDLKTYAQLWTITFIHLVERDPEKVTVADNDRLLYAHLAQRFYTFRENLRCAARNTLPDLDAAFIGTHDRPYEYDYKKKKFSSWETAEGDEEEVDADYVARHRQIDISTPDKRRKSAAQLLDTLLDQLGHDKMVETLQGASDNNRINLDARVEATRRLTLHYMDCEVPECRALAVKKDEQVGAADAGSVAEQA